MEKLHNLFSALQCFEYISGLKVNTSKTRHVVIGDIHTLNIWAKEFACGTDKLPFKYLGLPLGAKSNAKSIYVIQFL